MRSEESSIRIFHGLWALTNRELKKWYKEPVFLLLSLIQPVIWLGLFGKAMNIGAIFTEQSFNLPGLNIPKQVIDEISKYALLNSFGTTDYFSFLAIGMLAFVSVFTSITTGMSIVWDRRFGILDKLLSTPIPRGTIIISKVLNGIIRSLTQSAIALIIAILLGLDLTHFSLIGILETFSALFLMTIGLGSIFVMVAIRSTSWQSQMAVMNLLNLPLTFTSNAMFPIQFMPDWLQYVAKINPVSYAIDICRQALIGSTGFASMTFEYAYLSIFAFIFSFIGILLSWKALNK
ncbi:MAG: ABC transporter permease [Thermoproteota archaeon]